MAQFNPDVAKQQDPNYWYWSRPIPQPTFAAPQGNRIAAETHADTSKSIALKGIGDIAGSAVQGADSYLKMYYTDIASNRAEKIRDEQTADVEQQTGGPSILAGEPGGLPGHIQAAIDKSQPLQDAKDSGKLPSDTYYKMRLAADQKDVRSSTPPGYWPDVDAGYQRTTGMDPANAYLATKMRDLHTMMAANDADKKAIDKGLTDMYQGGNEDAAHVMNARKAGQGPSDADTRAWIAKQNAEQHKLEVLNNRYKIREREDQMSGNGDLLANDAERETSQYAHSRATSYYDTRQLLLEPITGRQLDIKMNPQDKAIYAQNVAAKQAEFERDLDSYGSQVVYHDASGHARTRRDILGKKFDEIKTSATSVFGVDMRLVKDADLQTATYWRQAVQSFQDESQWSVFTDKYLGDIAKKTYGFEHVFGAEWMKDYAKAAQQGQFPEAVQKYLGVDTLNMGTATPKDPWVVSQSFGAMYKDGFRDPGVYNWMLNQKTYGGLLSPLTSDEGKRQFIDHFYLPENAKFLSMIAPNSQFKVFNTLSQPKVTDQVWSAGKPEQMVNYKNSVEGWFRNTLGDNVRDLNKFVTGDQAPIPLTYHWDDKTHNISITDQNGRVLSLDSDREWWAGGELNTPYVRQVKKTVRELNAGMGNLAHMYTKEGKPEKVDEHLFDTLQAVGFDLDETKMTGLPAKITDAIRAARPKQHVNPEVGNQ